MRSPPQKFGGEVCSVRPDNCTDFVIEPGLGEERRIAQWLEDRAFKTVCEIDLTLESVYESYKQDVVSSD